MIILVTGGAGFIGSNLIHHLLSVTEHSVINIDKLTYAGNLASVDDVREHPRYQFEQADIADSVSVARVFEKYPINSVMHLAAESHVDRSIDGPNEFIQTNIVGTFNLLQNALHLWRSMDSFNRSQFRFLHVSTDEVYGSLQLGDPPFQETSAYQPHSPYSASKAASDHLARSWHDTYGLPVIVSNCSNNFGPFQFPEKLIPVVILKCLKRETIPVYGRGENIRDWIHVLDHCEALLQLLDKGSPGQTYNIGGTNEWRNLDLVRMLCRLVDELIQATSPSEELITFVADRPGHDFRYAIDSTKIKDSFGWTAKKSNIDGLKATVRWYLENPSWWQPLLNKKHQMHRLGFSGGVHNRS